MRTRGEITHSKRGGRGRIATWAGALLVLLCLFAGCGTTTGWQSLVGGGNESILSLAVYPANPSIIFAGASDGTLYRANGASTGLPLNTSVGLPKNTPINVVLPDPTAETRVYAATNHGLYVSGDTGDTWSPRGVGFPADDAMEALSFGSTPQTLVAGFQQHGAYVSHDAGKTWQPSSTGLPSAQVYTLFYDSAAHTLYAGLVGQGIYASTDDATTWMARATGLPAGDDVFMLAEMPDHGLTGNGPTLYAATAKGLYASTDGGQQWNAAGTGIPSGRVLSLATDPTHAGTMYAGTDHDIYESTDGGQHWTTVASGIHTQVAALAVTHGANQRSEVFAGAGALYRYPPRQASVNPLETAIPLALLVIVLAYLFLRQRRAKQRFSERRQARLQADQPPNTGEGEGDTTTPPNKWDAPSR